MGSQQLEPSIDETSDWARSLRRRSLAIHYIAEMRHMRCVPFVFEGKVRLGGRGIEYATDFHRELGTELEAELRELLPEIHTALGEVYLCESPIERTFYLAALEHLPGLEVQFEVGPYRLDFAIVMPRIAIELDGQEWHSSPRQRAHDARRDRFLQLEGWRVFRFTGSEVFNNVHSCVADVRSMLKILS